MRHHLQRASIIGILGVCLVFLFRGASKEPYTLTIAEARSGGERRIDLTVGLGNSPNRGSVILTVTNNSDAALRYAYHSTGPEVKWEFDFKGVLYEFESMGQGSGIWIRRDLEHGQSIAIPTTLYYGSLPKPMREAIYASDGRDGLYIKAKIRATVMVEKINNGSENRALYISSDWERFRLGIPHESS